jgi:hypothetical protein
LFRHLLAACFICASPFRRRWYFLCLIVSPIISYFHFRHFAMPYA